MEKTAELACERGILFHTGAVQAEGKIPINMRTNSINILSLSGHKLHAPKGVGVLYLRKGTKFSTFLIGGHQEKERRGDTENISGIIGLGKACELAARNMGKENTRVRELREKQEKEILVPVPNTRIKGNL